MTTADGVISPSLSELSHTAWEARDLLASLRHAKQEWTKGSVCPIQFEWGSLLVWQSTSHQCVICVFCNFVWVIVVKFPLYINNNYGEGSSTPKHLSDLWFGYRISNSIKGVRPWALHVILMFYFLPSGRPLHSRPTHDLLYSSSRNGDRAIAPPSFISFSGRSLPFKFVDTTKYK